MTRDEILTMKAGREMDALVAEKVMGQTNFTHPGFFWQEKNYADGDGWEGFYCPVCDASQDTEDGCCIRYSTDIAAAMDVFEWLRHQYFRMAIYQWDHTDDVLVVCEPRHGHGEIVNDVHGNASTVPLALCRAAMLTVIEAENAKETA